MTDFSKIKNPYDVLRVTKDMTLDDIKKVYRAECLSNHPDKHPAIERILWETRIKDLNEAWEVLSTDRETYDKYLDDLKSHGHNDTSSEYVSEEESAEYRTKEEEKRREREAYARGSAGGYDEAPFAGGYRYAHDEKSGYYTGSSKKEKSNLKKILVVAIIGVVIISIGSIVGLSMIKTPSSQTDQMTENQNVGSQVTPTETSGGIVQPADLCITVSTSTSSAAIGQSVPVTVTPSGGFPPYRVYVGKSNSYNPAVDIYNTSTSVTDSVHIVQQGSPLIFDVSDSHNNADPIFSMISGNGPLDPNRGIHTNLQELSASHPVRLCVTSSSDIKSSTNQNYNYQTYQQSQPSTPPSSTSNNNQLSVSPQEYNSNLIKNGDFSQGLDFWSSGGGVYGPPARLSTFMSGGQPRLSLAGGYIEQSITIPPTNQATLTFLAYADNKYSSTITVYVINSEEQKTELDSFFPSCLANTGCTPDLKSYDISSFSGQAVTIEFDASMSLGNPTYLGNIQLVAKQ